MGSGNGTSLNRKSPFVRNECRAIRDDMLTFFYDCHTIGESHTAHRFIFSLITVPTSHIKIKNVAGKFFSRITNT